MAELLFGPTPHTEAVRFIASKPVVSREVFDRLLPELRARAFVISGVTSADVLRSIRDRIAELPAGADWEAAKADIADNLHPYLASEDDPENTIAAERRAELLLRTHGFTAYSVAKDRVQTRQVDVFPYVQYMTMGDSQVRPTHAALDGVVTEFGSPFHLSHHDGWEWGCRCHWVALSKADYSDIANKDEEQAPDQKRILDEDTTAEVERTGRFVRNGRVFDMRSAYQRGVEGAKIPTPPGAFDLTLNQIKSRYDEATFEGFQQWAEKTTIPTLGKSVWEWINAQK